MKITITFTTNNAEFEDDFESALNVVARQIKNKVLLEKNRILGGAGAGADPIYDGNGNRIGMIITEP